MSRKILLPRAELQRLYEVEKWTQRQMAEYFGCSNTPIVRCMREYGIKARSRAQAAAFAYPHSDKRKPFDGNALERGYLCGFCRGDAHISLSGPASETIVVRTGSTRSEQVELFRLIFEPYSHIWQSEPDKRGAVNMAAFLDAESFHWLLDREDAVPAHILANSLAMLGYLAGYTDAEGHIGVYRQVVFTIESCDSGILNQLHEFICAQGIECPPPLITKRRGSSRSDEGTYKRDYWRLGIYRKDSLLKLFEWLGPYLRHAKRRHDMEMAIKNIQR